MKKSLNYITALPDFIEMQRLSFSWFISQGLADELSNFSSILDFSGNIESLIFGQDYRLIKPMSTALEAKKDAKSYVAQLQLLIEIRDKTANIVLKRERISIVNLPLMTNSATFIINGCERIIVSQIIRSPGIYFEKNKKQKRRKRNPMVLSTASPKLKPFAPIPWIKTKFPGRLSYITDYYEINSQLTNLFGALRLYKIICNTSNLQKKLNRIETFLKLVKKSKTLLQFLKQNLTNYSKFNVLTNDALILSNFLTFPNLIQKYPQEFSIQKLLLFRNVKILNDLYLLKNFQFIKLIRKNHNINKLQTLFSFKNSLIYLRKTQFKNISENSDLQFLKFNSFLSEKEIADLVRTWENYINLKPIILFSLSKKKFTYQDFSQYREKYEETDFYKNKYETKDLYTAILIPEYGSWVRFVFNREKERDALKHTLKNKFEDDISIQTDKLTKQPVIHILKEMGLTDLEICQNLQHSDFFYFTVPTLTNSIISQQPLLRFNSDTEIGNSYQSFSEALRIFDPNYYRLGQIGRYKINNRLNLKIPQHYQNIIYEDIFAIIDRLITLSISKTPSDDIDHLKNRRVRSVGELLQNLVRIGFQRLARKISSQVYKADKKLNINLNTQLVVVTFKEFFGASQLSQYMDQTNPLSALTHKRRISGLGPGGFDRDRISFAVRDIHPSHYGRICPIETPEGQNVGLIASLTTCARVNQSGFLETPFWRVINGKVIKTSNPIYLTAELEDFYKIAPADTATNPNNYLLPKSIPVRYKQDFMTVEPFEVDFIAISNVQIVSAAASLIPFFEHDDANRALMGSNMQRQSVPLLLPQKPIVGTGLENQIAIDSGFTTPAINSGIVSYVSANKIIVTHPSEKTLVYNLQKYQRSNQETCINQRPFVWVGDKVESGQVLADGPGIDGGELSLGQNVLIAYMPWHGYNFEDAILINERLVYEDIFTSIHIEKYEVEIAQTTEGVEKTTKNIPNLNSSDLQYLDDEGIITKGTFVKAGDILVGKVTPKDDSEQLPEAKLLRAIFGAKAKDVRDTSLRMPNGESGRVIDIEIIRRKSKGIYSKDFGQPEKIRIFIAQMRKIQVGDKIAGRHGNKGIISRILSRQDMPFLPDGTPIDIVLNPLGVPSRMNVGQLYECLLGLAGQKLNRRFKILPFDEMYGQEISRILINKKLREASIENNEAWLFNPYSPGKMVLIDGRTGKEFENPISVGNAYMLKLIHLVDDKIHARATGPYSLVTQQPLGGKAQHGGQRFGEMEVWALEGFGAAHTLQELLTIKSDDMQGRNDTLNAIVKGQSIPTSGIPESFKVLLQELRCIGLDISTYQLGKLNSKTTYDIEVNLMENYDPISKRFSPTANITNLSFY
jgi:DNA-directed RNA polymerase subunit beta